MDRITPEQRRKTMQAVKSADTKLEIKLRKALWRRGCRYRKNYKKVPGKPDIVFMSAKVTVFCDSEFWHGYNWAKRKYDIKSKRDFWWKKIERNISRDREVTELLQSQGWAVLRFWESDIDDNLEACVETIINAKNNGSAHVQHSSQISRQAFSERLRHAYVSAYSGKYRHGDFRENYKKITLVAQRKLEKWKPGKNSNESISAPFQVIDFFSGCGGLSLGFASVSQVKPFFRLIGGCDIEKDSAATYERNFAVPCVKTDIRLLIDNQKALNAFVKKLDRYDPCKPLVILGCAPCQGFTSHRKKRWSLEDPRNTLVGAFAAIASRLNPTCIVMENVPEMLSKKYWNYFVEARGLFQHAGYTVKQSIYNAASFGVPQERFRAVVVAMKKEFLLPEPLLKPKNFVTVRQAIGSLPAIDPGQIHKDDHMHRSARHRRETLKIIRKIPKDGGSRPPNVGPRCLDRVKGFYDVYGRLNWDKPSITVTHYARNPASGRFIHPEQDRGLTMREAAILQSFPNGFEFKGAFDSIFGQIGEAVPPKFACAIAASILVELLSDPPAVEELSKGFQCVTEPVSNSFSSVIAGLKMVRKK